MNPTLARELFLQLVADFFGKFVEPPFSVVGQQLFQIVRFRRVPVRGNRSIILARFTEENSLDGEYSRLWSNEMPFIYRPG